MGLNVSVINSCQLVDIKATSYGAVNAVIKIRELNSSTTFTQAVTYSGGAVQITVAVTQLSNAYGVYEVTLLENAAEVAKAALFIHCDIDCCLVNLTNELIDCACDCPKCASSLAKAQKIFLLLQSALSTVALIQSSHTFSFNGGYYNDIFEKYMKAKQICDNSCGCDC